MGGGGGANYFWFSFPKTIQQKPFKTMVTGLVLQSKQIDS